VLQEATEVKETSEDVEAGVTTPTTDERAVEQEAIHTPPTIVTPTDTPKVGAPMPSPLINNKVFPVPATIEVKDETPKTRANALPPLKSINTPIRSTR